MTWFLLLLFVVITTTLIQALPPKGNNPSRIELVFKWKNAELNDLPRNVPAIDGHPYYIPENNILYGLSHDVVNDVIYAAVPRNAPGVPSTVVILENVAKNSDLNPTFSAFPDFEVNEIKSCDLHPQANQIRKKSQNSRRSPPHQLDYSFDKRYDTVLKKRRRFPQCNPTERLISAYEPVLDKCGRLWILDTGVLEYTTGDVIVKTPQLWIFNVKEGPSESKLIRRFDFPTNVIVDATGLSGLVVDIVNEDCEKTFAYIPNQIDDRIVVYDFFKDDSWFFESYSFSGDKTESDFKHEEHESHFKAGVSSITLGKELPGPGHFRTVYYTAGSSTGEYSISSRELRSRDNSPAIEKGALVGYRGTDSQAMAHVFDQEHGVLFFAESQTGRVRCWNTGKPLRPENLITIFESKQFIYASHISIDPLGTLWFMSNRYPLFKAGVYNHSKHNIRLYKALVSDVIAGTACEPPKTVLALTKENFQLYFNITEVITDDLLK